MRRFFIVLAAVLAHAACVEKAPPLLRVGTNPWPGYSALHLAEHLGYYEGSGIRMVQYPSSTDSILGLKSGLLEAAALTMDEAYSLADAGIRFKVVLVLDFSAGADAVLGGPKVRTLKDLKGKKVGAEFTALGAFMLSRTLDHAGLSMGDITAVPLTLNEQEEAFAKGAVDAVVTFEPVKTNIIARGGRVIFDSARIPREIIDVLAVREEFYNAHPETVARLLKGYFKALPLVRGRADGAAEYLAAREGATKEEFLNSLDGLELPDLAENTALLDPANREFLQNLDRLESVMHEKKLLTANIDHAAMIGGAPLRMAAR